MGIVVSDPTLPAIEHPPPPPPGRAQLLKRRRVRLGEEPLRHPDRPLLGDGQGGENYEGRNV